MDWMSFSSVYFQKILIIIYTETWGFDNTFNLWISTNLVLPSNFPEFKENLLNTFIYFRKFKGCDGNYELPEAERR